MDPQSADRHFLSSARSAFEFLASSEAALHGPTRTAILASIALAGVLISSVYLVLSGQYSIAQVLPVLAGLVLSLAPAVCAPWYLPPLKTQVVRLVSAPAELRRATEEMLSAAETLRQAERRSFREFDSSATKLLRSLSQIAQLQSPRTTITARELNLYQRQSTIDLRAQIELVAALEAVTWRLISQRRPDANTLREFLFVLHGPLQVCMEAQPPMTPTGQLFPRLAKALNAELESKLLHGYANRSFFEAWHDAIANITLAELVRNRIT